MEAGLKRDGMESEWHRQADEFLSHCPRLNEHTPRPIFLFLRDFSALFSATNIIVSNNVIVFNVPSVSIYFITPMYFAQAVIFNIVFRKCATGYRFKNLMLNESSGNRLRSFDILFKINVI